jgi:hypothetical protein
MFNHTSLLYRNYPNKSGYAIIALVYKKFCADILPYFMAIMVLPLYFLQFFDAIRKYGLTSLFRIKIILVITLSHRK